MRGLTRWVCYLSLLVSLLAMLSISGDIVVSAISNMSLDYLLDSPSSAGRKGGVFPIIVSTCLIVLISIVTTFFLGLGSSYYLSELGARDSALKSLSFKAIEILAGVPSIVFGLFGNAFFSIYMGMGFSILSGGLTLSLMAMPLFVSTLTQGFNAFPDDLRKLQASLALGRLNFFVKIIFPFVLPSLIMASVLSIGRSLAETAALIFTSGYVDRMPESIFDSGRSLSIHIYDLSMNVPGGNTNAYKSAFVLLSLIFLINSLLTRGAEMWRKRSLQI